MSALGYGCSHDCALGLWLVSNELFLGNKDANQVLFQVSRYDLGSGHLRL